MYRFLRCFLFGSKTLRYSVQQSSFFFFDCVCASAAAAAAAAAASAAASAARVPLTPAAAQAAFIARGGPAVDPLGLDPDGDGFVCGWDPAPYRAAAK